jgi:plasmid stabilization system protein ParE
MTYRVLISKKAWDDIEQVYFWLAVRSSEAAERWRDSLFEVIDSLKKFPERCPRAPESGAFGTDLRELSVGRRRGTYRIIFRIRGGAVHVLRVRHGARRGFDED